MAESQLGPRKTKPAPRGLCCAIVPSREIKHVFELRHR